MGRGRGPNTADSYIGSLISLTSRSEIRYEGVLYTVDTENSNIALQNVRSFGTEGRKKEGPQIPASDKVYDYIIFRGSDIKDLQVKSSPPPPLHPPPPHQPTDPAIISLQAPHSQPQYPLPSSLGPYNVGTPAAGSSSEPSAPPPPPPPPPYMGMPPSPYRSSVPPLYPPAGVQSWGPPPPLPGANGSGLAMPMYWHGYYRPPPAGHMQHQPMPPQPPPSLAVPPQGQPQPQQQQQQQQPQPIQQSQQGPQSSLMPQQVAPSSRPQGPIPGSGCSAVVPPALQSHTQPSASSDSKAPVSSTVTTLAPLVAATTAPASIKVTPTVSAMSTAAAPVVSSVGTTAAASTSGVPISAASSLPLSMQGVSAMITPVAKNPRRIVGNPSQVPSLQAMGSFYQGPSTQSMSSAPTLSSESLTTPQSEAAQSSKNVALTAKSGPTITQSQVPPSLEQKTAELTNVVIAPVVQSSPQTATSQAQVSQPLLPLPTGEQNKQASAQQGSHGAPVGRKNRWQGNGHQGNGNYNRRGRGRGSGSGRGLALANPTQQFTEDFDFTAMNEKFKKAEVRGTLGVKHDEEEYEYDDGNGEEDAADSAQSDAPKTALYNKHDFFDSLSCDATHGGRGERTKFSEQRKIDTETFGAFSARSSGGRGGRRSIHRGGYFGGGRGHYAIGRGGGHGRGRASSGNV